MATTRVLLVDDHKLVRSGIRALLDQLSTVDVVAEASNGREAVHLAEQHEPDVVIMDIAMPELNGIEATRRIKRDQPAVRVLLLSMYTNAEYVSEALAAGADGYVVKDAGAPELELSLQAIIRGESYLSPAIAKQVMTGAARPGTAQMPRLTPRQREILQLIAEGNSTKSIAAKLGVSVKTVETHRANLMERLDIRDVAGLVRYALRQGVIAPD